MRQPVRFVLALLAGLALLTWGASVIIEKTTRDWFERDLRLRAELAVSGAREVLISNWRATRHAELRNILIDFTRDERILSAAACNADLGTLTSTPDFPSEFSCRKVGPHVHQADPRAAWPVWHSVAPLPRRRRSQSSSRPATARCPADSTSSTATACTAAGGATHSWARPW